MASCWEDPEDIERMIREALSGVSSAYEQLMDHYRPALPHVLKIYPHFRLEECLDEAIQDTWVRMWKHALARFELGRPFLPYLACVCKRAGASHLETCRPTANATEVTTWPQEELGGMLEARAQLEALHHSLRARLQGRDLYVYLLKYVDGLEAEEVVRVTGLTTSQVNESLRVSRSVARHWLEQLERA